MPKRKAAAVKKDESSDSDSGPEDRGPAKKEKPADDNTWDLGNNRSVKLTEFKGKWYINIREYYNADGELKPGKKGIMLSMPQWQKFHSAIGEIEDAVKKHV